ncbi:hypothetical protein BDN72DRAFT_853848 [Pluteus cervinus]|uniref:Uncharacterized protein n=1 Tax=Pluteus cervinus TaxID=181527 RepID=A0ACD3B9L5_9AGAR|nr:hypothetical protein BDN72DRAFT_853848 [Pluteus cervinus]
MCRKLSSNIYDGANFISNGPRTTNSTDEIPDLTGKVVIVTDYPFSGIGRYIAQGARFLELDLADLKSIKYVVEEFKKQSQLSVFHPSRGSLARTIKKRDSTTYPLQRRLRRPYTLLTIHYTGILQGILKLTSHDLTDDGYDLQLGVNVLALISTASTAEDKKVRVIKMF